MNILMITKFVPLPADSGGKRRSLAIAKQLARMGNVTLCSFDEPGSDVPGLEALGVTVSTTPWRPAPATVARGLARTGSISSARFWDPAFARMVDAVAGDGVDHLQVEYTQLAPYSDCVAARRRVLDMHNVESALAASFASTRGWIRGLPYRTESAALRRVERKAPARFDLTTVVSEADRLRLPQGAAALVVPNGWDPSEHAPPPAEEPVAAFVALMRWPPNDDAARHLGRVIWPRVRNALPEARLLLVGRDPTAEVRSLHGTAGIEVTGTVADVSPYLASARVGLAPLRAGGGSRLKILESLDAGRPVVATATGAEGLEDLVGDGLEIHDDDDDFAAAIVRLLSDPEEAARAGARGRVAVAERHSWTVALAPLVQAIEAGTGSSFHRGREGE